MLLLVFIIRILYLKFKMLHRCEDMLGNYLYLAILILNSAHFLEYEKCLQIKINGRLAFVFDRFELPISFSCTRIINYF